MKKIALVLLLVGLIVATSIAQEEPIPPRRSRAAKVGGFGGFTPGWLFVDVKPINDFLVPAGGAPLKDKGVVMYGGAGAAYVMFIPNLRIGGVGMSGSIKSTALDASGIRREAKLDVGYGGVTLEYVVPIMERLDFAFGTMLGGGGIDIILREDVGGIQTWNGEWSNFGSGNYQNGGQVRNITRTLSGSFFVVVPSVSVEYAILGWAGIRLGASYVAMLSPSWTVDDKYELLGVPTKVNGQGFMLNLGLFVGTY